MHGTVVLAVAAILGIGVVAQWVGWRVRVPAIVFLLAAGLVLGPLTGLLDPDDLLGELLFPFVNLAVAVILFEGAMGLGASRIRDAGRTVWMLLTVGASLTLVLTAAAGRYLLDVGWPLAWLVASVLIVTGPTVIGPLVRTVGLRGRLASILEAEGTLIDPVGAIVTVAVFQLFYEDATGTSVPVLLLVTFAVGLVLGGLGAALLTVALARFIVPDELHNVTTLATVVLVFAAADAIQAEAGLVAVTVMGFALATQNRVEVRHVLEFNETLRILFITGLFILLGARIRWDTLASVEWRNLAFLVALVVVVRPVSVALATIRSGLARRERVFIAATAPRGIVAAAIASIFSLRLSDENLPGSQVLVSATFTVIAGTVALSGFGARPLARRLHLVDDVRRPVVILGTNPVATALAETLEANEVSVELVSLDRKQVSTARLSGLSAMHASVLDEGLWDRVSSVGAATFVALTGNDEANVIACGRVAPLVGRRNVFRVASDRREHAGLMGASSTPGRRLMDEHTTFVQLSERLDEGWHFRSTTLTQRFTGEQYLANLRPGSVLVCALRRSSIDVTTPGQRLAMRPGDTIIAFEPPDAGTSTTSPADEVGDPRARP